MADDEVTMLPPGPLERCLRCRYNLPHGPGHDGPSDPAGPETPEGDALGWLLARMAPGLELAEVLTDLDLAEVDDYTAVEVVAAHKRQEAYAAAQAAAAAAQLATRASMNPGRILPSGARQEVHVAA